MSVSDAKNSDMKVNTSDTKVDMFDMKNLTIEQSQFNQTISDQTSSSASQQPIQLQTQATPDSHEHMSFQKSSDPAFWGPGMWRFLHSMAANYPESPSPQFKSSSRQFFFSLRHLLPCEKCRGHFNTLISKRPPDTDSAERLQEWVMWLHNEVNLRIKPHLQPWTMQKIKETYKSDSYVQQVISHTSRQQQQHPPSSPQLATKEEFSTSSILPKEILSGINSSPRVKQTLRDRVNVTLGKRFSLANHRRLPVNFFQVSKVTSRNRKSTIQRLRKQQHHQQQQIKTKLSKPLSGTPVPESTEEKDCGCKK